MCLIEKTGDIVPMSVRAIGAGGLQETPLPQIASQQEKIWAKPIFTKLSMFRFVFLFLWKSYFLFWA